MTIFRTYGGRQIIRDAAAIQQFLQILHGSDGFNIVHKNGAYVLDTKTNLSSSEQFVQPVISNEKLERGLSQAAKEHERKRTLETEELVKAVLKCDQNTSTMERARHLASRCEKVRD